MLFIVFQREDQAVVKGKKREKDVNNKKTFDFQKKMSTLNKAYFNRGYSATCGVGPYLRRLLYLDTSINLENLLL